MKAIYKSTGEIVEVEPAGIRSCSVVALSMYEAKDGRIFPMYALEFEKDIDWERRRYEIAKAALQGFCANSEPSIATGTTFQQITGWSIEIADILIAELKKGGKDEAK